ncbi:MAG: protoheme IX farnesyltransferase [Phycisphaera sp.]|nr:protoheme IX farnesyltransferase [Phycisphaera sp.]
MTQLTTTPQSAVGVEHAAKRNSLLRDYIEMSKLRITTMVVITAWIGYAIVDAGSSWLRLAAMFIGTALSCIGAGIVNQAYEKQTDALMPRTRNRPIASGRVNRTQAAVVGVAVAALGVAVLWVGCNALTACVAITSFAVYTFIYTPMKRMSSASTIVGAVPGALPPVIGVAAAAGSLTIEAWLMFAIMFLWQLPHFLAIAYVYREDYARAGMPMLPVKDPTGSTTFTQVLLGCLALLPLGLLPTMMGVSGMVYFTGALVCGLVFLAFGVVLVLRPSVKAARRLFFASLVYLPVVLMLLLVDRV